MGTGPQIADSAGHLDRSTVTAVLWDIDGTLLTSGAVGAGVFLDAVADVCGIRPDGRGLDLGGRIDPEIAESLLSAVGAPVALVPRVLARLHDLAVDRQAEYDGAVQTLAGVAEVVHRLFAAGVRQTVVTGNIETVGRIKLAATGLVPPIDAELAGYGDHGATRVEIAEAALGRLGADGWTGDLGTCWIVGDTPRDLACARILGLRCALVATGRHSLESLAALDPDVVITGFDAADELLARWGLGDPG